MTVRCDVLVIGSGAGGLSAAITAAGSGLRTILVEKAPFFGGTTAWSGGWVFAPGNPVAVRAGIVEPKDAPCDYLRAALGNDFDAARVAAFLRAAPAMVGFLEELGMEWEGGLAIPDTYGRLPGAGTGGRSVIAAALDGRAMGPLLARLAPPMRETTFGGLTIQAGPDLRAFMSATRSPKAFTHVARRVTRHGWDLIRHGRATQLRNGQALVGRLLIIADRLGVDLRENAPATELIVVGGAVRGAVVAGPGGPTSIRAARGVVLATGGFPHDAAMRARLFPAADIHLTVAAPSATGDGLRLAEGAGGRLRADLAAPGAWCPVSEVPFRGGTTGRFPHIIERGKPGLIAVRRDGRRFCNEGDGYHDYVAALLAVTPPGEAAESWLICSRAFQRRYGLGIARPHPVPEGGWVRRGYLKAGRTIPELARACGIDPHGLARTVEAFDAHARRGEDPEFGRGSTSYNRLQGDPEVRPNPCIAPIGPGPFYAVRVVPGSFGTFAGIAVDARARALDADGVPVPGLFAVGADAASVMGGHYPAGGINLGPALAFGHVAGRVLAGREAP